MEVNRQRKPFASLRDTPMINFSDKKIHGGRPEPAATEWGLVTLLVGAGIFSAFQVGKAPPVLPEIRAEFQMSLFAAGWVLSIFNVIGSVFGSGAGAIADAFGHRRLLLAGLSLQALGSLTGSFAPDVSFLLATRALEGVGLLIIVAAAPAMIVRITKPADLRIAMSIWSCFLPAGAAAIMFLTPVLNGLFGWRGLWQVNAALLAGYAALLAAGTASVPAGLTRMEETANRVWRDLWITLCSPGPVLLAAIFLTYSLEWYCVMGFLPILLIEQFQFHPAPAAMLTAIIVGANVPGNLAGGWLLHRGFHRWKLITAASLVMGSCSLVLYSPQVPFFLSYTACLLFSGAGGLLPASVLGGVPVYAPTPHQIATTSGLITQGSQLGQVIGPPVLALIVSAGGGWKAAPWLLGSSALIGVVLAVALGLLERRKGIAE